jgi:hypothetical protein
MKRKLLARSGTIATRQRVYRVADGLEIDEVDHYEVHRSRVLYEDVILVTYHRYRGVVFLILTGLIALLFGASSLAMGKTDAVVGFAFLLLTAVPVFVAFVARMALGVDEINVYSRRSQARLRFWFRKARARELMNEITAAVRRRQDAVTRATVAGVQRPPEPAPPPEPEPGTPLP